MLAFKLSDADGQLDSVRTDGQVEDAIPIASLLDRVTGSMALWADTNGVFGNHGDEIALVGSVLFQVDDGEPR
ncbi:MAG: hypothetical protein C0467_31710 [Planctomycetaceae bacterium]|nr:hypothetical protein [Planctomycetaceae bacterium]